MSRHMRALGKRTRCVRIADMRPLDTSYPAYVTQIEIYRRMQPEERLALALEMSDDVTAVLSDGVRMRHPDYDESAVQAAVSILRLGEDAFRKAFPGRALPVP